MAKTRKAVLAAQENDKMMELTYGVMRVVTEMKSGLFTQPFLKIGCPEAADDDLFMSGGTDLHP